ncbi:dihydrodipicolinate synthase family protein [Bryobacter aggregatus]|uniref:dihydrodipicolinate synthase family protein n=1 Tax=Bryobacter aggregatus TaxID=360054 RepID=UPI00068CB845|nr:dihydrodipicolinate synthase family protein [Bryobacter aggregatus]
MAGVYPILVTTFKEDGSLDIKSQLRLVDHLLEQGAHGLGLFGNASEGYALEGSERIELMRAIASHVNGRVPLIASSGHTGTRAAVELSKQLAGLGATGLMVLPPYFLKTDGEGLLHYFSEISNGARTPIMIQDAPLLTQVAMPPPLLARMAREIEFVTMAKIEAPPTAPKVTQTAKAAGESLKIFGGLNAQFFIEEYDRGARGTMPGSDCIAQLVQIWNALERGDKSTAWDLFTHVLPLLRFELQPGMGVSAMKNNLVAAGIIESATVRHPTASLDATSLAELKYLRERL